jgi:hypothetical protein
VRLARCVVPGAFAFMVAFVLASFGFVARMGDRPRYRRATARS